MTDQITLAEAIGGIVIATARLESQMKSCVASLTKSPLSSIVVQGISQRTLCGMAKRLLERGIGSTAQDAAEGRTERLGLIPHEDTLYYLEQIAIAEGLFDKRDRLVHANWFPDDTAVGGFVAQIQRTKGSAEQWTVAELLELRQAVVNVTHDLFAVSWNSDAMDNGMDRMDYRNPGSDVQG